ncbi:hypothetical protein [Mycolicibacterium agri]|uniref:hypothetical protein n=1 Tax=Mycolicibacterium agri TaxID=36811 RepID=UPI001F2A159E|nr:hypothetical protein [Mycolicibacterium agri]
MVIVAASAAAVLSSCGATGDSADSVAVAAFVASPPLLDPPLPDPPHAVPIATMTAEAATSIAIFFIRAPLLDLFVHTRHESRPELVQPRQKSVLPVDGEQAMKSR